MALSKKQITEITKHTITGLSARDIKTLLDISKDDDIQFKDVVKKAKIKKKIIELEQAKTEQAKSAERTMPPPVHSNENVPAPVVGPTECPVARNTPLDQYNGATWTNPWPGAYKKFIREG